MAGVWVAELERFGYTLLVVERTKQKALDAMSKEYIESYFKQNKAFGDMEYDSIEEMVIHDEEFMEYYKVAMDEIYCRKMEYGEVEWC